MHFLLNRASYKEKFNIFWTLGENGHFKKYQQREFTIELTAGVGGPKKTKSLTFIWYHHPKTFLAFGGGGPKPKTGN